MRRCLQWYREMNARRPLAVKSATTCCIFSASDTCAQLINPQVKEQDLRRTLDFALCGAGLTAPFFHGWYLILDARLPGKRFWPIKLAMDATLAAPVYIFLLMGMQRCLRLVGGSESPDNLRWEAWPTEAYSLWVDGLKVCPAYQAVNFALVPPAYRVQWMNGCQFFWNIYVAYICGHAKEQERSLVADAVTPVVTQGVAFP
mmetsp:Transcript_96363/g.244846  ORF Transcript_96363/g.244846 Transcript_96363/m.244846 type:complete len:202 (+) Transcript_96363:68-673(+)